MASIATKGLKANQARLQEELEEARGIQVATRVHISSDLPLMDGVGAAGATGQASDAGHVHPTDTSRQAAFTLLTTFGNLASAAGWLHNDGSGNLAYSTPTAAQVGAESALGNPGTSGYVLASTAAGVRSWVPNGGDLTQPGPIGSATPNTVKGTTITATAQFSGPGTGLTGTAASLSIGGSASYFPPDYVGGQQTNPQVYFNSDIGLKVAMTGYPWIWSDTLWINGYSGSDVPNNCALHFYRGGPRFCISSQNNRTTSYGTAYEVLTQYNSGQCVAWCNVTGFNSPVVNAGFNISSVTVNGNGNYTAHFSSALADAKYSALVTEIDSSWGQYDIVGTMSMTASSFVIMTRGTGGGSTTPAGLSIACFR